MNTNPLPLTETEEAELSAYCANKYADCPETQPADTSYLDSWEGIISEAEEAGAAEVLNKYLLRQRPVSFLEPDLVRIEIYNSFAGPIPIIYIENVQDFEQLITNLLHKGVRPDSISKTGASFISGKTLRFIVLSAKPYSNVTAAEVGVDEQEWCRKSILIRRAHECTHFFTKQHFGQAHNNLHDELMADFMGIYDAFGFYRAEWFLRFIGVIEGSGSRIDVYTESLSPKAREALISIAEKAAHELESWSNTPRFKSMTYDEIIRTMCRTGIEGMIEGKLSSEQM